MSETQIARLKKEYCDQVKILKKSEKNEPDRPQYIPLVDIDSINNIKIALGKDLSISDPDSSIIKLYLPSKTGGKLELTTDQTVSEINLHYFDDQAEDVIVKSAVWKCQNCVMQKKNSSQLEYNVPANKFGWYFIKIVHNSQTKLSNKFTLHCKAIDDGSDWVPWNFWYWPFQPATTPNAFDPNPGPCHRFDQKFSTGTFKWEEDNHKNDSANGWEGHCADGALASFMFTMPGSSTDNFSISDLEFYATEYCRRRCRTKAVWRLPSTAVSIKPSPRQPGAKKDSTDDVIREFHETILEMLNNRKEALLVDLRDENGNDENEIWNHCVYKAEFNFSEHANAADNEKDIYIEMLIFANIDKKDHTGTPESGNKRQIRLKYRLLFNASGKPEANSDIEDWEAAESVGKNINIFAPRYVHHFDSFRNTTPNGDTNGIALNGNPEMTLSRLKTLGMDLRKRYYDPTTYPVQPMD